jgi:hypothetical protein
MSTPPGCAPNRISFIHTDNLTGRRVAGILAAGSDTPLHRILRKKTQMPAAARRRNAHNPRPGAAARPRAM